jgi:hypothetical protein
MKYYRQIYAKAPAIVEVPTDLQGQPVEVVLLALVEANSEEGGIERDALGWPLDFFAATAGRWAGAPLVREQPGITTAVRPMVRALVRNLLAVNPAYHELPKSMRRQIKQDMVKVAAYIIKGDSGHNVPAAVVVANSAAVDGHGAESALRNEPLAPAFATDAAQESSESFAEIIHNVDFPQFVGDLIQGVFGSIVDASIQQMKAYSELVQNAATSVDQFREQKVNKGHAREYLAYRYPQRFEICASGERCRLKLLEEQSGDFGEELYRELALGAYAAAQDQGNAEKTLVRAVRRRLAMDRQQLLATTVLMGINRIIVTNGTVHASLKFMLDDPSPNAQA